MKNSTKRIMSSLMVFIMLLGLVVPVFAGSSDKTTTLQIHKLKYDADLSTDKKIKNDGTEKTYDQSIKSYDASEYGEVGFTLYRLDNDKVVAKVKEENGNAQSVADKIAADIPGNTTNGIIKKVEVTEVKQSTGTDPIQMSVKTTTNAEYFLLIETTSPATVAGKAQPMLLQFPMRSADGKSLLETVHLYPKNKVDESTRELEFTKNVLKVNEDGSNTSGVPFEGADFEVYKGKPGSGEKLMKDGNPVKLTSEVDGKFKITGLTVGNYYLVEVGNDKVDSLESKEAKSTKKNIIASIYAKNDEKNRYAFRMDEDGHIYKIRGWNNETPKLSKDYKSYKGYVDKKEKLSAIDNMIKPSASKKLASKAESIGFSDVLNYEINVNVPAGFGRTNDDDEKIVINDKITEGAIIDVGSFKLYRSDGSEVTIDKYSVDKVSDNEVNITIKRGIQSNDMTKKADYGVITIKYNVTLSKDFITNSDTEIKNNITTKYIVDGNEFEEPENPLDPKNPNNPIPDKDKTKEVVIKTYTKKLKKVDSGIFSTGAVKSPLSDAEFILGRKIGEKTEYRKVDADKKYSWTESESEAKVVKSKTDGTFEFEGLASKTDDGTVIKYFAKEIKSPENYVLPANEDDRKHTFTFDKDNVELTIENNKSVDAPMTGYEKATITVAVLGTVLLISVVALNKDRKKENN